MARLGKYLCLCLIVIFTASTLLLPLVNAQTIPKPTVPKFSLSLVGPAYVVPTTYHLDQNTGQIVADIGYTNEYSAVEVTIKNQPLVFDYSNVHLIGAFGFYYNIQIKPHSSSGDWIDIYHAWDNGYGVPSNSEYTNLSFSIEGQMGVGILAGTQIDIHVQAMIGEIGREYNPNATNPLNMYPYTFHGETSDWSSTQTISIPANVPIASDSTPNPSLTPVDTANPTSNNSSDDNITLPYTTLILIIAVVILAVSVFSLVLYVRHLKRNKSN